MGPGLDNCVMVTYGSVIRGNRVKHIREDFANFSLFCKSKCKFISMMRKFYLKSNWVSWVAVTEWEREKETHREMRRDGERNRSCARTWKFGRREKITLEFPSKWKRLVMTREQRSEFLSISSFRKPVNHYHTALWFCPLTLPISYWVIIWLLSVLLPHGTPPSPTKTPKRGTWFKSLN